MEVLEIISGEIRGFVPRKITCRVLGRIVVKIPWRIIGKI